MIADYPSELTFKDGAPEGCLFYRVGSALYLIDEHSWKSHVIIVDNLAKSGGYLARLVQKYHNDRQRWYRYNTIEEAAVGMLTRKRLGLDTTHT